MPAPDHQLLRLQLDEQLRRDVELLYQAYLTKVRAWETVVQAQGDLAAPWPPLPLAGLLAAPPAAQAALPPAEPVFTPTLSVESPAPAPTPPARTRSKAQDFALYNAVVEVLDQLGPVFDKNDLCHALGFQPKKSNLYDTLRELVRDEVLVVDWYGLGNKPTRYRQVGPEPGPGPEPGAPAEG
jgi:hypothetical protein